MSNRSKIQENPFLLCLFLFYVLTLRSHYLVFCSNYVQISVFFSPTILCIICFESVYNWVNSSGEVTCCWILPTLVFPFRHIGEYTVKLHVVSKTWRGIVVFLTVNAAIQHLFCTPQEPLLCISLHSCV